VTMPGDTDDTDRAGVYLSAYRVTRAIGIFREQSTSDYGVDAQVEFKRDNVPTGRLVGLQIKTGPSHFGEPTLEGDGWRFRPKSKHVTYWVSHSLHMYILLVDLDDETIYWQELSERTFEMGQQGGLFVKVPRDQTLATAQPIWEAAADSFAESALLLYDDNLTRLSPQTVKSIRIIAEADSNTAALLAARFARGRSAPELVVRSLLENEPSWLSAPGGGEGLAAVAEYAHSHGLVALAVDALLTAADRDASKALRRLRVAGLLLMDDDRERSRQLLVNARDLPGGADDLHLAIGIVVAQHPEGDAAPVILPAELESRIELITDDEFVLSFRATRAERSGDLDSAVALFQAALEIAPDAAALMLALAQSLARRARTPKAKPKDRASSMSWAAKAVDQLHDWSGPTDGALSILLQAQMSAGQFAGALDRSLPSPDGMATLEEARRPGVQSTAAVAAHALGRHDLAAKIIDAMPEGLDRDLARARMRLGADDDAQRTAWLSLVDRLDESRPEALLMAVMRLGELGIDRSERIAGLVARHMVPQSMQTLASVSAAAVHELDATIPRLRVLAESDEPSALRLITILMDSKRYGDAEAAAAAAFTQFRAVEYALFRVDALAHLDRRPEVESLLAEVLTDPTLDPLNRQVANRRLAEELMRRAVQAVEPDRTQLWQRVERHMSDCVYADDVPLQDQDVWLLADAQLRLGRNADASATVLNHDPAITTSGEARLWLSIMQQQQSLTANDYRRMLDLADDFKDDAQLSAALLTTVITRTRDEADEPASPADERLVLDDHSRATAFSMLQAHIGKYGDETPIKALTAETPEALIAQMTALMRRDNEPLIEAVEMVRQARLPLGFLSLLARRPYSSTIAERPLGYLLTSAALNDDDSADEEAAAQAAGMDVVVDTSTLLVATEINEFANFRGSFRSLLMPAVSHADIARGRSDLDGRSSSAGFLTYDSGTDSVVASEVDVEQLLGTLRRFGQIEAAASSPILVPHVPLDAVGEIGIDDAAAWLAPIALAKERNIALWSDDLAQRRLARVLGVQSFGTTTLQQLRTASRFLDESLSDEDIGEIADERQQEVATLLEKRIVDAPTDVDTIVQAARKENWNEAVALVTVGRPGWWHMAANPFDDLQKILREATASDADTDTWRYHAMWGVVRVAAGEPSRQAMLLASVALLALTEDPDVGASVRHLEAANHIAVEREAHKPADYLYEAEATLINAGVQPAGTDFIESVRARLDDDEARGE
jgi:tetratricopeptide (TPR) repeat protein